MDFTKMDLDRDDDGDDDSLAADEHGFDENDEDNGVEEEDDSEDEEDEDDEEEEDEGKIVAEINRLQDELRHDPNNYDNHLALISKLKMIGELECLREAREKMNRIYPLSPELWLEWINDEISVANTVEERRDILKLFQRAVGEYLDVNLWLEYVQYAVGLMDIIGVDGVREILDQALNRVGLHVQNGSLLWGVYRDLESGLLEIAAQQKKVEEIPKALQKLYDLYGRQLSVPLLGMDDTITEFEQWLDSVQETHQVDLREQQKDYGKIQPKFEKAKKRLDQIRPYENRLAAKNPPNHQEYLEYLEVEKTQDNLARVQCLYERAVADNCLQPQIWLDYLQYCDGKLVLPDILLPIYERAVRNCYWESLIWIRYMEAVERLNSDTVKEEVEKIFERALKSTAVDFHHKIWLTYLHFLRRHTDFTKSEEAEKLCQSFRAAIGQLEPYHGPDHCYEIYQYLAKVKARFCSDAAAGRDVWNEFLEKSESLKYQASTWIDYANFEQWHGNETHFQAAGLKALQFCSDYPETVAELLLRYEREIGGDIGHYYQSSVKYEKALKRIREKRAKHQQIKEATLIKDKDKDKKGGGATKRKAEIAADGDNDAPGKAKPKKSRPAADRTGPVKTDESKLEQTIFVSNLSFHVDENEIREAFAPFGTVQDVRLARKYNGMSKGFGYVEFETVDAAREALKHDRMLLQQRPVFITEMGKKKAFDYGKGKEENKLYLRNVPPEIVTKDQLVERIFPEFRDDIVDVRLVTRRSGFSKGMAFVEMRNSEQAAKAVREKDGLEIDGRKLFVAISDPSQAEKKPASPSPAGPPAPNRPNKMGNRPSSGLVPHSVVMRARTKPSLVRVKVDNKTGSTGDPNGNESADSKKPMSNDQFRSMFLKN